MKDNRLFPGRNPAQVVGLGLVLVAIPVAIALIWIGWSEINAGEGVALQSPTAGLVQAWTAVPTHSAGTLPPPQVSVVETAPPSAASATPLPPSATPSLPPPTVAASETPPPTASETPTATLTEPAPAGPTITAGDNGVNLRTGPGLNYTKIGYLEPGAQATVTGRYSTWFQVDYGGQVGWVYGEVVTAANVDQVAQVVPPPSPTPLPTPTAAPTRDVRGLVANAYWVEGAPGPFGVGHRIWFNMDITNQSGGEVSYLSLGTLVAETNQYQRSWTYSSFVAGKHFTWRDHIEIPAAGTYNLYLHICFTDGYCVSLWGPIQITVQ